MAFYGALAGWTTKPQVWVGVYGDRVGLIAIAAIAAISFASRRSEVFALRVVMLSVSAISGTIVILQYNDLFWRQSNQSTPSDIGGLFGNPNPALLCSLMGAVLAYTMRGSGIGKWLLRALVVLNLVVVAVIGSGLGALSFSIFLICVASGELRIFDSWVRVVTRLTVWALACVFALQEATLSVLLVIPLIVEAVRGDREVAPYSRARDMVLKVLATAVVAGSIVAWIRDERFEFVKVAYRIFQDNLLFGIGPSSFADYSQGYGADLFRNEALYVESPHNLGIHFVVSFGLVGVLLLAFVLITLGKRRKLYLAANYKMLLPVLMGAFFLTSSVKTLLLGVLFLYCMRHESVNRPDRRRLQRIRLGAPNILVVTVFVASLVPLFWLWQSENTIYKEIDTGVVELTSEEKWKLGSRTGDIRILANSLLQARAERNLDCSRALDLVEDRAYRPEVVVLGLELCGKQPSFLASFEANVPPVPTESHSVDLALLRLAVANKDSELVDRVSENVVSTWTWCDGLESYSICGQVLSILKAFGEIGAVNYLEKL